MYDLLIAGGGIIGLTSAVSAARRGMRVCLLDAASGPALETSFANAGELSFGYSGPWATPGILRDVPGMLLDPRSPLRIRPDTSSFDAAVYQMKWLRWMAMNSKPSRFERNKRRIVDLSAYSKAARASFGVPPEQFDHRARGTLQLFRDIKKFEATVAADELVLRRSGVDFTVADAARCVEQEPALANIAEKIAGGLIFHADETGDCYKFAVELAKIATNLGVELRWNTRVTSIKADRFVRGVATTRGDFAAAAVVLATGHWTRELAAPLGLKVPIYPVRGYSLTAPIANEEKAPVSTVLDQDSKVAITRFEGRIRAGGTAEVGGVSKPEDVRRHSLLVDIVSTLFPGAITTGAGAPITHWSGLRPMTPDGTPIVGATVCPGLYINAGHGTLGWTQSFGSAEFLGDVLIGAKPSLDPSQYALARYGRWVRNTLFDFSSLTGPEPTGALERMSSTATWR